MSLPSELRSLVNETVTLLGHAIEEVYGKKTYALVEETRRKMKDLRLESDDIIFHALKDLKKKYQRLPDAQLEEIALSFSLMMEIMNRCEMAYRSYKVQSIKSKKVEEKPYAIVYVLTAHPTEARSEGMLNLFDEIQKLLLLYFNDRKSFNRVKLKSLIKLSLRLNLANHDKPTVAEEAQNIYRYILQEDILDSLVLLHSEKTPVFIRTWVGGDKDGHNGINDSVMVKSLNLSRGPLVQQVLRKLHQVDKKLNYLTFKRKKAALSKCNILIKELKLLKRIQEKDGAQVKNFRKKIELFHDFLDKNLGDVPYELEWIKKLIWIFPALVIPLELREDSEVVSDALNKRKKLPIEKMLEKLHKISSGYEARWYAREFVLSMCESASDYNGGLRLMRKYLKKNIIPVTPLFETRFALDHCEKILRSIFMQNKDLVAIHKQYFGSRFETMVGYSDSSKESGVLASRVFINEALKRIDRFLAGKKLIPVFFHGSGGSVERGGGSIREQTQWWPKSAIEIFKVTTQGEMVARTFSNSSIFRRQIDIILEQLNFNEPTRMDADLLESLHQFSDAVANEYGKLIKSEEFMEYLTTVTPYTYLDKLKIGSRPTSRSTGTQKLKIRAIPWVLTWTQMRLLFPTWWGIGTTWDNLSESQKKKMKTVYEKSNLFKSFIKQLGFTYAKVELGVFYFYLDQYNGNHNISLFKAKIENELQRTKVFLEEMTGETNPLWFRPWLNESIELRSSMIHPLNVIQMLAIEKKNHDLLRDTVTGISCGMLTTG
jgi:phosphoenolpyruvate carboxylase